MYDTQPGSPSPSDHSVGLSVVVVVDLPVIGATFDVIGSPLSTIALTAV
jgi:hypothetical protein